MRNIFITVLLLVWNPLGNNQWALFPILPHLGCSTWAVCDRIHHHAL